MAGKSTKSTYSTSDCSQMALVFVGGWIFQAPRKTTPRKGGHRHKDRVDEAVVAQHAGPAHEIPMRHVWSWLIYPNLKKSRSIQAAGLLRHIDFVAPTCSLLVEAP